MNKGAIQKFAVWARTELIAQVSQRAYQYGIDEKGCGDSNAVAVGGRVLSSDEKTQRQELIGQIQRKGYKQVIEEVAYTWFNRFIALRFMEVNNYLPSHIRVFSDAAGGFSPEILKDVLYLDLPGLDKGKIAAYIESNESEALYRYLLLTQCNALNEALPNMFERMGGYTELLFPNNSLRPESVLGHMVTDIPEEDWKDAVQIIGWLYQYYNTEPKDETFALLKNNVKITKERIPSATQLFTPDWIVRYMVENSLGRLWLESHPNATLKAKWKYYLDEAEQTPEVAERLRVLRSQLSVKSPEDIRLIDPCMGSGHILVYAFDVLMQIYECEGYNPRDAVELILEKNLYGLDIDHRAYQLAYLSLMMKARQYNRRIFTEGSAPQVYYPCGNSELEEYGSLLKIDKPIPKPEFSELISLFEPGYEEKLHVWNFKRLLSDKYDVVVTNPPYMGSSGMSAKMSEFMKTNYPDSKSDLSTAFMEQTLYFCKPSGFMAMINIPVWMFLSSYEKLREKLLLNTTISNMLHFGRGVFGADFGTTSFVISKVYIDGYTGAYRKLYLKQGSVDTIEQKEKWFFDGIGKFSAVSKDFLRIPGAPIAYWVGETCISNFAKGISVDSISDFTGSQHKTADNDKFLRFFWEVSAEKIKNNDWIFYIKGGEFRKWYGNILLIVDWSESARNFYTTNSTSNMIKEKYWFADGITYTSLSSSTNGFRYLPACGVFDIKGPSLVRVQHMQYCLAFFNSSVALYYIKLLNPTITLQVKDVKNLPIIIKNSCEQNVIATADQNISLSRTDWDSFETSWDFKWHPLVHGVNKLGLENLLVEKYIEASYMEWAKSCSDHFNTLKANEEELNRIFIDIYGMQDELTPEVEEKDVTVRKANLGRDIRSFISYSVGCMFGRYSLDEPGLILAGYDRVEYSKKTYDIDDPELEKFATVNEDGSKSYGSHYHWVNQEKFKSFPIDVDNIIPICDDEYFDDDITGRFVRFVKTVYGADTLEENLKFIADALGGSGTPREVIRSYFLNGFYADHLKVYQKRPIYWLFDSGKKNGFKALIYMHRYSRELLARMRTDYVHEQQERYRTQLAQISDALTHASGSEAVKLSKRQQKIQEQALELQKYEEKIHHLADQNIEIDLDDGVVRNYALFEDVLAKIK